jgi:hypothetical protein
MCPKGALRKSKEPILFIAYQIERNKSAKTETLCFKSHKQYFYKDKYVYFSRLNAKNDLTSVLKVTFVFRRYTCI